MDFNHDLGSISSVKILDPDTGVLTVSGSAGLVLPIGSTAERAPATGVLRFNSNGTYEGYTGTEWVTFQGTNSNLTALSNLNGTGILVQTGPGTFSEITIAGTSGNITVTNGNGVAGNPTINLATAGTAGSGYVSVTTDAYGRVTAGSTTQDWGTITGTPTTLAGYGITDAIQGGSGIVSFSSGLYSAIPAAGTIGAVYYATDTKTLYYDNGTSWDVIVPAFSGDVSSTAGGTTLTLATVNSNVGSFGSSTQIPVVTVNAKGLVTGVTTATIASGALSFIGDATGTGTTGSDTTLTLATVNSNVGTFGDASHVSTVTVNGKGLVTAVSETLITPVAIGAINIDQLGVAGGVATLDALGKLTNTQIPAALVGALQYQGTWNATTNTPTLASGVGVTGQYYKVSVSGNTTIDGQSNWQAGDLIVFNGTTWDGVDGMPSEVLSVNGNVGAVNLVLASSDFVNQGTTTTFLKGNAAGNPSWSSISLTTDVSGTLQAAQFPALSGDLTTTAGSLTTTLATVNTNVGTYGSSTNVAQVTVNAKGLVTAVSDVAIPLDVTIGGDATGSGTTSTTTSITLNTVNSNVGSFGSSTQIPVVTVNAKGLVTAVSTATIASGALSFIGDATGTGTTGSDTTLTLATVNSNVGTFGDANSVATVTVNAKGLVTAVSETTITPSAIGAVANAGNTPSIQSDVYANIPAAGTIGAIFIATDTHIIYRDTGAVWEEIGESSLLYTENASSPVSSTVTGTNAVSIGSGNTVNGANALATGYGASTSIYGAQVHANGSFANAGDAQSGKYVLRTTTSNGTVTEAFLDGSSARIVLPNNSAVNYSAQIVARRTDQTGFEGAWRIEGLISRDASAATTTLVGNRSKNTLTRPAGWDVEVAADTTNGALIFNVTGATSQTIRWVISVTTSEVAQ